MKKTLPLIVCFLITARLFAQDCSQFMYMRKGKTVETTMYNAAGSVMSKNVGHVLDVTNSGGATVATVESERFDKDGNSKGKNTLNFKCDGNMFYVDMSSMGSENVKFNATNMGYPTNLKVGDHLPDVDLKMSFSRGAMAGKEMNAKITNRQVAAQESVTTPAGTWTAFKITYQTKMDMPGMPANMGAQTTTEWFVPNFGPVQWSFSMGMTMKVTAIH